MAFAVDRRRPGRTPPRPARRRPRPVGGVVGIEHAEAAARLIDRARTAAQSRSKSSRSIGSSTVDPGGRRRASMQRCRSRARRRDRYAATVGRTRACSAQARAPGRSSALVGQPLLVGVGPRRRWSRARSRPSRSVALASVGAVAQVARPSMPCHERRRDSQQPSRRCATGDVHPAAIDVFSHYYAQLESGETGIIAEADIEPLDRPAARWPTSRSTPTPARTALGSTRRDQAQRRARHVDGHGPGEVPASGPGRADLPRHHRAPGAARPATQCGVRLPLVFMNSFRTRDDTLEALAAYPDLAGRRPAARLPAEPRAEAAAPTT